MYPEGVRPTDDRGGGKQAEIPAVEGVLGPPVHEENFADADALAALPNWQRSATTVAIEPSPRSVPSTVIMRPSRQTVCPGNAAARFSIGTPIGKLAFQIPTTMLR